MFIEDELDIWIDEQPGRVKPKWRIRSDIFYDDSTVPTGDMSVPPNTSEPQGRLKSRASKGSFKERHAHQLG
jgi:hypothetical protein